MVEIQKRMVVQFSGIQLTGIFAELNEIIGERESWRQLAESGESVKERLLQRISESARNDSHRLKLNRGLSLLANFYQRNKSQQLFELRDVRRVIIWQVGIDPDQFQNEWLLINWSSQRSRSYG